MKMDRTQYWELIEQARNLATDDAADNASAQVQDNPGSGGKGRPSSESSVLITGVVDKSSDVTTAVTVDPTAVVQHFVTELTDLDADSIASAWLRHHELLNEAYSWQLWGAAHLLKGGCGTDSFEYFRNWLILQGREAFDAVIDNPDALVDLIPAGAIHASDFSCEELSYAPHEAYEQATGEQMADHRDAPDQPDLGEEFDFADDDEMARRYPRLFARVGG